MFSGEEKDKVVERKMKITKSQLKQIIKEEVNSLVNERSTERAGGAGHLGTQAFRLEKGSANPSVAIRQEIEELVGPYIKTLLASDVPPHVTMSVVERAISDLIMGHGELREDDDKWIQGAEKDIEKRGTEGVCTGDKFGGPTCKPGTKRYNLAKTFRKMAKEKKNENYERTIA